MKPGVFYFHFVNEDVEDCEPTSETKGFNISPAGMEILYPLMENETIDSICGPIEEEFGVHDACGSPTDEVESVGYTSYEVEPDNIPEVMNRWHQALADLAGAENLTPWMDLGNTDGMNDTDIHTAIANKVN